MFYVLNIPDKDIKATFIRKKDRRRSLFYPTQGMRTSLVVYPNFDKSVSFCLTFIVDS